MRPISTLLSLAAAAVLMTSAVAQEMLKPVSYEGKTVLITGSTDGLGRALALALADEGAHVIVHGRNAERGQQVVDQITAAGKGSAEFRSADFSTMQAVREFADAIAEQHPKLDLLVNNAGIAFTGEQPRRTSADGYELQFAVNYLAGWILVHKLRPNLAAAAPSRILNVASGSAHAIDFDDVMLEQPGAHARGYGQSKLAQVSMTIELAPAFAEQGITMISLHPATMMNTTMVTGLGLEPKTSVEEGQVHVMGLAMAPGLEPGGFYVRGEAIAPRDPQPHDAEARARLVTLSEKLTGVAFE